MPAEPGKRWEPEVSAETVRVGEETLKVSGADRVLSPCRTKWSFLCLNTVCLPSQVCALQLPREPSPDWIRPKTVNRCFESLESWQQEPERG